MEITRKLQKESFQKSMFLLGPRKVGKSTFLKTTFNDSLYIDLLDNKYFYEFSEAPWKMYELIKYQISKNNSLAKKPIIIDEIQRVPILLDDVHRLIEDSNLNFILCGSSARKLVRGGANMLGGRAGRLEMRGLSVTEIANFNLIKFINNGGIPSHYLAENSNELITNYIYNYLDEEIKAEALVRNLKSFSRFLELSAITNGEEVNYSNISRDVGVDGKSIVEYFQILIDTLIGGYLLPYFDKQKRTNISKAPKFYLFDTGIVNNLKGIVINKEEGAEFGKSFEHIIYNELMIYKSYSRKNFPISFWRNYDKDEVDFILGDAEVSIEVKSSKNPGKADFKNLYKFNNIYKPKKSFMVTNSAIPRLIEGNINVLPYNEFIDLLWSGDIIN